jgi:lauroyl/myristoyl acyltransferase
VRLVGQLSTLLGGIIYATDAHSARIVRKNWSTVVSPERPPEDRESDLRRLLSLVTWNALMINSLPVLSREEVAELVPIDGTACLDGYLDDGHPVLVWSYHFGVHPLIVAAILHARGYPIHVITHVRQMPVGVSVSRSLYLHRLKSIGDQFPVIDPREGIQRRMLDALRDKECLYVTPDYMSPANEGQPESAFMVPVDFLGRRALLSTGGLRLPKRLKAKVTTVISTKHNGDKIRLLVEPFELPTNGLRPEDLQCDLQACMRRLEAQVMAYPDLWWDVKREDLTQRLTRPPEPNQVIQSQKEYGYQASSHPQ